MFDKADYLATICRQIAECGKWDSIAHDKSVPLSQRQRAEVNVIAIQREINELYSALLAHGVSHGEIRA